MERLEKAAWLRREVFGNRVSERRIQELAARGDIPSVLVGARRFFSPPVIREWVAAGCPKRDPDQGDGHATAASR